MSTGRCVSVILVGEYHDQNSRRREILNTIKQAEKKYNIPTCYFYESPAEGYFDREGLFNGRQKTDTDVFVFPLEPALEISGIGKNMYLRQNPPSVVTDILYLIFGLSRFSRETNIDLLLGRISEVNAGIYPTDTVKKTKLNKLEKLVMSYQGNPSQANFQACEQACQDMINMLQKYLGELSKNDEYKEIIKNALADLDNEVDPMIKLQALRNSISITVLKDKLYRDEISCQVAIIIVGNDHLKDYQQKIASSTGDNVCLRLIKTIDLTTNIREASFQESINNLFIPLVQLTHSFKVNDKVKLTGIASPAYKDKEATVIDIKQFDKNGNVRIGVRLDGEVKEIMVDPAKVTSIDSVEPEELEPEAKTGNFGGRSKRYKSKRYKSKRYKSKRYRSKRYKSKR